MSGEAFTWEPEIVIPETPKYNIIETQSESMKRNFLLFDDDGSPENEWMLDFGEVLLARRNEIRAHYLAQRGPFTKFSWSNPPTYITGEAVQVRYKKDGGYKEEPVAHGQGWSVQVVFIEERS